MKRATWVAVYVLLFYIGFIVAVNTTMELAERDR